MALTNAPKSSYVTENWLFDFTADNSNCLEFFPESSAGNNDGSFVSFGNILAVYTNFTVEFWINPDDVSSVDFPIISRTGGSEDADDNDSFLIKLLNDEIFIQYEFGSGSNVTFTSASANIAADTWTHVAVVRSADDDNIKLYLNGTLNETFSSSDTDEDPTGSDSSDVRVFVGTNFAKNKFYDGELAHVRVWNVARTASQISKFYDRLVDSTATGLQGYWKFDEGSGTIAYDSSSNSNNGTLSTNHSDGTTNLPTYTINGFTEYIHAFGLSFYDTDVDGHKYHGSVLNNITLRDSIDITRGTSNTSNFSLTSANFTIEGADLYKLLFNGTNNYLNKTVRVYSQFNDTTSLSNCQRIFTGKLVDIKLDHNQNITMQINSHRPWDKITFPQTLSTNEVYQPVVYGDYEQHADQGLVRSFANKLFPVPFKRKGTTTDHLIITPLASSNIYPHYYDAAADAFLPIKSDNYTAATKNQDIEYDVNVNIGLVKRELRRRFRINATSISSDGTTTFDNANNLLIDSYSSGGISHAFTNTQAQQVKNFYANFCAELGKINDSDFDILGTVITPSQSGNVNLTLRISFSGTSGDFFSGTVAGGFSNVSLTNGSLSNSNAVSDSSYATLGFSVSDNNINTVNLSSTISSSGANRTLQLLITDFVIYLDTQESFDDSAGRTSISMNNLSSIKNLYLGTDGLTESWTGGNTAIAWGIEAFRDLMIRFAGHGRTAPTGYTQLYYDRRTSQGGTDQNNWKIRYWQLEPVSLKQTLDKLAYEFGFVYKFAADGTLKLIHVLQSSELSATLNLTADDLDKVQVSTTGLNSVVTKMTINNKLHPAESGRYYSSVTNTNVTTRNKYNLGDKEGIKNINLDMNVGEIPTSANSDCNADFYSYYNNIIGDIKILVSCDIVNMAKGYQLETGDIVTFTDMPVEMFGTDFSTSKYFMIIETKRSLGKVSVVAREVG